MGLKGREVSRQFAPRTHNVTNGERTIAVERWWHGSFTNSLPTVERLVDDGVHRMHDQIREPHAEAGVPAFVHQKSTHSP